jgi:hypothetical protein
MRKCGLIKPNLYYYKSINTVRVQNETDKILRSRTMNFSNKIYGAQNS